MCGHRRFALASELHGLHGYRRITWSLRRRVSSGANGRERDLRRGKLLRTTRSWWKWPHLLHSSFRVECGTRSIIGINFCFWIGTRLNLRRLVMHKIYRAIIGRRVVGRGTRGRIRVDWIEGSRWWVRVRVGLTVVWMSGWRSVSTWDFALMLRECAKAVT